MNTTNIAIEPQGLSGDDPRMCLRTDMSDCKFYVYLNPKAPQDIKDFVAEHFSDGTLVSAVFMQEMTGGLADEGPALFNYAAAFLDETGELNLLEYEV
jgi:hypothetical protein